jgi:hypothetical protein
LVILSWISDQLTVLAEAFGEPLTAERVEIYVGGLADLSRDQLCVAFRRALYELKWFPKLAELRDLAGSKPEELKVEAQAAWNYVNDYLRKWGVDRLPVRSDGKLITAPPLDPRLEYAVRQIGGLWRLNQVTDETYHFIFRDFCEAYALAPLAELMAPQLSEKFGIRELAGQVKELSIANPRRELTLGELSKAEPEPLRSAASAIPRDMSPTSAPQDAANYKDLNYKDLNNNDQWNQRSRAQTEELTPERREQLRQKLQKELASRGIPRRPGGLH